MASCNKKLISTDLRHALRTEMITLLQTQTRRADLHLPAQHKPTVLFIVGVNGVGKTSMLLCDFYIVYSNNCQIVSHVQEYAS